MSFDDDEWDFDQTAEQACAEMELEPEPEEHIMEPFGEDELNDPELACDAQEDAATHAVPRAVAVDCVRTPVAEPVAATQEPAEMTPSPKGSLRRRRLFAKTPPEEVLSPKPRAFEPRCTDLDTSTGEREVARRLNLDEDAAVSELGKSPGERVHSMQPIILPESEADWWLSMTDTERNRWMGQRVRGELVAKFQAEVAARTKKPQQWGTTWHSVPAHLRARLVEYWVTHTRSGQNAPEVVLQWFRGGERGKTPTAMPAKERPRLQSKQFFLTFNGRWGEVQLPPDRCQSLSSDDVAAILRENAELVAAWKRARHEVGGLAHTLQASSYAMCFELCTRTWNSRQEVRVHLHALLRRSQARMRVRDAGSLRILGCVPFTTLEDLTRSKRATNHQAQYYCTAPKIGSIFTFSTDEPYLDFPVNGEWIWSLVQAEKITLEKAEDEFIRVAKNLPRHLSHLNELRKVREQKRLAGEIVRKEEEFRKKRCAFRKIPQVVAFMAAFRILQSRRKFLVLGGPSRMGKTEYVRSLVEPVAILELNCACCLDPPLGTFRTNTSSWTRAPWKWYFGIGKCFSALIRLCSWA